MDCSIGSSWLSDAERPPRYQVSCAMPVGTAVAEDQFDRIVLQLFDDRDVVDRVQRRDRLLVDLGEGRRVVLGHRPG